MEKMTTVMVIQMVKILTVVILVHLYRQRKLIVLMEKMTMVMVI